MKLYEFINPSDPWTFKAESHIAALLATLIVGDGKAMVDCLEDGEENDFSSPFFAFSGKEGIDNYIKGKFGYDNLEAALEDNYDAVANALTSFLIASKEERETVDMAVKMLSPEDAQKLIADFNDKKRSSMNDFGTYAISLGQAMKRKREEIKSKS